MYTSPVCLAIAFFFAEKKHRTIKAREKIELLCTHVKISGNSADGVINTLKNKTIDDLEDGLEYYAALESQCKCIITEDKDDFYFSDIEVLNSREFYKKYLLKG